MGFKIKTFKQILESMANWVTSHSDQLTNFHVGSSVRTFLESVAIELESLYFEMYKGFKYAVENAIFNSFDFSKNPATYATGEVTISFKGPLYQDITIPEGFKFSTVPTDGRIVYFRSMDTVICKSGITEATIRVECTEPGVVGNVAIGSIKLMSTMIPVVDSVTNDYSFNNGYVEESTEERKKRFADYISTLSKGTLSAIRYGCISVPGVAGAHVEESLGLVRVYVHDVNGNSPPELHKRIEEVLIDYRAAGIEVEVFPIVQIKVDLVVEVQLASGLSDSQVMYYQSFIQNSLTSYLNSFSVSENLTKSDIIRHIMTIASNIIVNASIDLKEDVIVGSMELIRSGVVTIVIK